MAEKIEGLRTRVEKTYWGKYLRKKVPGWKRPVWKKHKEENTYIKNTGREKTKVEKTVGGKTWGESTGHEIFCSNLLLLY